MQDTSRNSKPIRYRSNDPNIQYERGKRNKQRDYSGPIIKDSPLNKFNFNSRMNLPTKKSAKALKDDLKSRKNGMKSSRENNWESNIARFHIPNINSLAKNSNIKKGALKSSFSYSKNEQGLGKIVNGLSLSKNEINKRMKNVPKELTNINHLRKSYDSRNARTNSAVEKLRIANNSNNPHLEPLTSK